MSTNLTDKLKFKFELLETPLTVQLAVQGFWSHVNSHVCIHFQCQGIDEEHLFDIIIINSYDLILGTPWLYQYQACNPGRVIIGSDKSVPVKLGAGTKLITHAMGVREDEIEAA
jgi:hypothetical protein